MVEFKRYSGGLEEALIRLHRGALRGISHGLAQEQEEHDIRSIQAVYLGGGGEFLTGFIDGRLVAMGGFKIVGNDVAELKRMRITPELQGQGIGSALLALLEALAREKNIRKLILETASSRPKTLSFYGRRGYARVGEGLYGDQATVHFEKHLGSAAVPKA